MTEIPERPAENRKLVREIMTPAPVQVGPATAVSEVARLMRDRDIGAVLVSDGAATTGLVTDRDLVLRVLAEDQGGDTQVREVITPEPMSLRPDDYADVAVETMRAHAVRRVPVVEGGRAVGIVSLGDLARLRDPQSVLGEISAQPPNNSADG